MVSAETSSLVSGGTLNPAGANEKTWGWFAIFNIWANDVQSLFGYSLVASLFISYGVSGWTAFAALICAGLFVMFMVNLSGAAGERYGMLGSLTVRKTGERVLLPDGTIAGSCLTQRRSVSVLREWGLDWHTIGTMISATPAQWIGDETVGRIAPGARAHWLEIRNDQPVALWLSGQRFPWRA